MTHRESPGVPLASTSADGPEYERSRPLAGTETGWPSVTDGLDLRRFGEGLAAPLLHRLRLGEGGLFVVNATLAWKGYPAAEALGLTVVSLVCLLALYLFNDIVDARDDQHNPKKDRLLAAHYVHERRAFLTGWVLMTGAAIGAGALIDGRVAACVFAVSLINIVYSLFCKKVPLLDMVWVGVWGGAYASIVTDTTAWIVMVGAMTAVCHTYQISEDRDADAASGFATSAMLGGPLLSVAQAILAVVLVATAWTLSAGLIALTFAGFFAYWLVWRDQPHTAWMMAKAHFSVVWAYLLLCA